MTPRATYRLQFHKDFTFADAEAILPYLAALGISHVYASPITTAQPGSTHGYDVVDPTRINPELGGEEGFARLSEALKAHGLGLVIDIVPNHMGIAGSANGWWQDVLRHGKASRHARFFDINWAHKLLLPFLGAPLPQAIANGALTLKRDGEGLAIWAYDTHRFPIRPEDEEGAEARDLADLLDSQHYRLAWWRAANDDLHWRRFFTITELAGLRAEDPLVFEETHRLYFRLFEEGRIDGVRIDHVDGLTDPGAYLERLRARMPGAWIVVEKILAPGEAMPADWPIDGTSGYDFMEEVTALLHAPAGEAPLARHWAAISGRPAHFHAEELQARRDMLAWEFEGQLSACVAAFHALARSAEATHAFTAGMLRRALRAMLWVFPVYRTYGTGGAAPPTDAPVRETVRRRAAEHAAPGEMEVVDAVLGWLAGEGPGDPALAAEAVRRFQQLSAPIAAKAVEDTAFYRYGPLLSRNDVGFDPSRFALSIEDFHAAMARRAASAPVALLATATHDHKRGEDVRARLAVLSGRPQAWIAAADAWRARLGAAGEGVDPGDVHMLLQTLVGAWPGPDGRGDFAGRVAAWAEKAVREAKLRSSWAAPDAAYEGKLRARVEAALGDAELVGAIDAFVAEIAPAAEANGLVQTFLRCVAPGVPDLYQGTEFADLSLVDPDNRRPVDYAARRAALEGDGTDYDARKQRLIANLLALRREESALFAQGDWAPLPVAGSRADHVLAFRRAYGGTVLRGAARLRADDFSGAAWWGDTRIDGTPARDLLGDAPIWYVVEKG
jgi:(1->4)-alpha-D-glucan 1-alpha-D-glucosylmutase